MRQQCRSSNGTIGCLQAWGLASEKSREPGKLGINRNNDCRGKEACDRIAIIIGQKTMAEQFKALSLLRHK